LYSAITDLLRFRRVRECQDRQAKPYCSFKCRVKRRSRRAVLRICPKYGMHRPTGWALTDARPERETAGELQNWTALLIIRIL
jgi:hypothetical protein